MYPRNLKRQVLGVEALFGDGHRTSGGLYDKQSLIRIPTERTVFYNSTDLNPNKEYIQTFNRETGEVKYHEKPVVAYSIRHNPETGEDEYITPTRPANETCVHEISADSE